MAEPQLAGQTVVVLGGSAGIGLATARRARAEGANVVITGRDPERLARAAADVGAIQTAQFDAADEPALQQFFDQLGQQLDGPIGHVLVAAGGPYYAPFAELDVADAMRYVSRTLALPLNVARFLDGLESPDPGWCRCTSGGRKPAIPWPRPPATRSSHGNPDSLKCPT